MVSTYANTTYSTVQNRHQTNSSTQCTILDDPTCKQDATTQVDFAAEDQDCWSSDEEVQKLMEELVRKKLV